MYEALKKPMNTISGSLSIAALVVAMAFGTPSGATADEAQAKSLVKAMSDYLANQKAISVDFDTSLEIVTSKSQKIALTSSGKVTLNRPDKVRASRMGGFSSVELVFDGKMLTVMGKEANVYAQAEVPGTVDNLIDALRNKYHRPVPGADLLLSNFYDEVVPLVTSAMDLGTGVIGGVECNHLAFRTMDVDWQIWIAAEGDPRPCRYDITSRKVSGQPQYSMTIRSWKAGGEVASDDFGFSNATNAKKLDLNEVGDVDELPSMFAAKGRK